MSVVDDQILYVDPETMNRLIAGERVRMVSRDGVVKIAFPENDPGYPNSTLLVSREVSGNAAHRRTWVPQEQRFVFEYVGDV